MCEHATFEFAPAINHMTEGPDPFTFVALNVRCSECHAQFHWRGISIGLPNSAEPAVTADAYTLLAPIAIGPGGVVQLLTRVGLEDRLVDPNAGEPPPNAE